jgi:hypothetical protein
MKASYLAKRFSAVFHWAEFSARCRISLCFVISRVELIRKDKEKFPSARKIPPSGKRPLFAQAGQTSGLFMLNRVTLHLPLDFRLDPQNGAKI